MLVLPALQPIDSDFLRLAAPKVPRRMPGPAIKALYGLAQKAIPSPLQPKSLTIYDYMAELFRYLWLPSSTKRGAPRKTR